MTHTTADKEPMLVIEGKMSEETGAGEQGIMLQPVGSYDTDPFALQDVSSASNNQPEPVVGNVDVVDYVLRDIAVRVEMGLEKYGTKLQTFNGRDSLWDAYQEALDLVMYLRQAILERDQDARDI